jgi:putative flippase GtrA
VSLFTSKLERIRFLRFSLVGVTGTIVDFGIMNLMSLLFGIPLVWAQAISFVSAVINNFLWNRYWTYPQSQTKSAPKQLIQFFLINLIGILIRTPLVPWFNKVIFNHLNNINLSLPIERGVISQNLSLSISITTIMLWNFFANRYWTYSNVPNGENTQTNKFRNSK